MGSEKWRKNNITNYRKERDWEATSNEDGQRNKSDEQLNIDKIKKVLAKKRCCIFAHAVKNP